jgi:flagellar hook-associated protein 3 FlgL
MRISNFGREQQVLRDLQARLADLQSAQQQQATGKRVSRPSDDPAAAAEVLRTSADLTAIAQFRKNGAAVRTQLGAEDAVSTSLQKILAAAKSLAVGAAGSGVGSPNRQNALTQLNLLIDQVKDLGNTQVGASYIFGGYKADAPPFQPTGPGTASVAATTLGAAEATVSVAGTVGPGVYRLTNDPSAPGSVTLTNTSDPAQTQTITGVTAGTTTLAFGSLGITLTLGAGWTPATATAPGSLDGDTVAVASGISYRGDDNQRMIETDAGSTVPANHTGAQLFGNALASLQALAVQLQGGTAAQVNAAFDPVDQAQQQALGLQAETGGILRHLDDVATAITSRETALLDRRSAAEEVDPSEAAVKLLNAQNSLQAAYAATGRVLSLALTDYLR